MKNLDDFIKMYSQQMGIMLNDLQINAIRNVLINTEEWHKGLAALEKYIIRIDGKSP